MGLPAKRLASRPHPRMGTPMTPRPVLITPASPPSSPSSSASPLTPTATSAPSPASTLTPTASPAPSPASTVTPTATSAPSPADFSSLTHGFVSGLPRFVRAETRISGQRRGQARGRRKAIA